ncbi:MAG: UDP-N-acetylmuramate dehydrogenase [candidate division Zixibacteria bacterium]|nr:UDP-N-acetylmuramate dehydrogenase [candidate division Zixibacteria bacterium]
MSMNNKGYRFKTYPQRIMQLLFDSLGENLKKNEALAAHTTFRIGGPADFFFEAYTPEELIKGVKTAKELDLEYFILGGGSNLLVSDSGFGGLVIKNRCSKISVQENIITAQSGTSISRLVNLSVEQGLSGLEFAAGFYGTLGGAVYGNAGAFGKAICDIFGEGVIFTPRGNVETVKRDYFEFDYRTSKLKSSREILLSATLVLQKGDGEDIRRKVEGNLQLRKDKLPENEGSAGSFFKNVKSKKRDSAGVSAGYLLEQVGAKEMKVGEAKVFPKHANIIINEGKATAEEVKKLASMLKSKVKEKFNIELEEEVIYIGE